MDYRKRIRKMKIIKLILISLLGFITFVYLKMLPPLKDYPDLLKLILLLIVPYSVIFNVLFNLLSLHTTEEIKSEIKVSELKQAILLELRYVLISLIENFTQFYGIYFVVIRLLKVDLKWFYELTEKYGKYFPDYLMNEIKVCMSVYENLEKLTQEDIEKNIKIEFLKEYTKEMRLRSQCPTMEGVQHYFEKEKSKYEESKQSIKPIYMALLSSILSSALDKLSASDKDFTEKNTFYMV